MAKYLVQQGGVLTEVQTATTSSGAADAGKIVGLDSSGRFDNSVMPTGVGSADTNIIQASEALSAGDLVNVWNSGGSVRVRKADGSTSGKHAHGFVLAAVSSGASATVYAEGTNTQLSGLTGGDLFLSATTPGAVTATAPSGSGQTVQPVGYAVSATAANFQSGRPITLA